MKTIAIVGGGIIGLSLAYKLSYKYKVVLLEKESQIGFHQSGRNSGVLHCGLYYKPNSLKAKFAYEGIRMMTQFCQSNGIEHEICGKIVVSNDFEDDKTLEQLAKNGEYNGLNGLRFLKKEEMKYREPNVSYSKALLVPEEGIVNYKQVMNTLSNHILNNNSEILLKQKVKAVINKSNESCLITNTSEIQYDYIINCAGLHSDRVYKKLTGLESPIKIIPFRGEYYNIDSNYSDIFNHLIYPVPNEKFPFLGIHFTKLYNGVKEVGPNAVLALKREGYRNYDISLYDIYDSLSYIGLQRFIIKNFNFVSNEFYGSFFKSIFVKRAQKLIPDIKSNMLVKGNSGVRAQAMGLKGELIMDFCIQRVGNQIHVLNAPSPGATSSLAIAQYIIDSYIK
jgi:L-2-hydroxyglutarate oxidase